MGEMDIKDEDCRITGYVVGAKNYLKAEHIPTGVSVDVFHYGPGGSRVARDALQQAVDRHMDNELAKL
jgi:hypothetical protein